MGVAARGSGARQETEQLRRVSRDPPALRRIAPLEVRHGTDPQRRRDPRVLRRVRVLLRQELQRRNRGVQRLFERAAKVAQEADADDQRGDEEPGAVACQTIAGGRERDGTYAIKGIRRSGGPCATKSDASPTISVAASMHAFASFARPEPDPPLALASAAGRAASGSANRLQSSYRRKGRETSMTP